MHVFWVLYGGLLLLAAGALGVIGVRAHRLCVVRAVDAVLLSSALRRLADASNERLTALARILHERWAGSVIEAALRERDHAAPEPDAIDDCLATLEQEAFRGVAFLHTLGRAAPPLAFTLAIVELGMAFRHDAGLLSLQKGLAETIAVSHAALAVLTGMSLSICARAGAAFLRRHAVAECRAAEHLAEQLDRAPGSA